MTFGEQEPCSKIIHGIPCFKCVNKNLKLSMLLLKVCVRLVGFESQDTVTTLKPDRRRLGCKQETTATVLELKCSNLKGQLLSCYSKTCVKRSLKNDETKILMTTGSLMKVESIAEHLQYFLPALNDNWS